MEAALRASGCRLDRADSGFDVSYTSYIKGSKRTFRKLCHQMTTQSINL